MDPGSGIILTAHQSLVVDGVLSVLCVLAHVGLLAAPASGQTGTATLVGQVTDPSGGVLPGVSVRVVQLDTSFRFEAVTNETGLYRVTNLQPGRYRVSFELAGFAPPAGDAVEVNAGDARRVDGTRLRRRPSCGRTPRACGSVEPATSPVAHGQWDIELKYVGGTSKHGFMLEQKGTRWSAHLGVRSQRVN